MATFTGTNADESITTTFVSPTVTASGGAIPSDADDTINAGGGVDTIESGGGIDTVTGGAGNDQASLGAGNDIFTWNSGDGNDVLDGGGDSDTLAFNGSSANEAFDISNNGGLTRLFRDVSADLSLAQIETINLNVLGGADAVAVHDLTGTATTQVNIDLAGTLGGSSGDGQADTVSVDGTNGDDVITATLTSGDLVVDGLAAQVVVDDFEATDTIRIAALGGDDVVNVSSIPAGIMSLILEGGTGEDIFIATDGGDRVIGGDGDDTAFLGDGDDEFFWNPGDDNDTIEGQDGADTLDFNGSGVSENVEIFANGGRVILFRDVASVGMDLDDTETIEFKALGGFDRVIVHDLSGTDVTQVRVDLAATLGGSAGDAQVDTIIAEGTTGNDTATLSIQSGDMILDGLASQLVVENFDPTDVVQMVGFAGIDTLLVEGGDGAEQISVTPNVTNARITGISPTPFTAETNGVEAIVILGNGGDDVVTAASGLSVIVDLTIDGGAGGDTIIGGDGDDALIGGDDDDTLNGQGGDDTLAGGNGIDAASYAGAVAGVTVALSVAGAQNTGGDGIDTLSSIENLVGSGFADTLSGTAGDNTVSGGSSADNLKGFAGNDVLNGEAGDDTLNGGATNDTLNGGDDNDTLIGQDGNDTLNGGSGTDTASYVGALSGVTVSLATTTAQNTVGDGIDTLSSMENLIGSGFADTLSGTAGDNTVSGGGGADNVKGFAGNDILNGEAGDDTLNGGATNDTLNGGDNNDTLIGQDGNDTLSGGNGTDTASYVGSVAGVTVALATTTAQNTVGDGTDTLSSIENLIGSGFADTLSGTAGDNTVSGGGSADSVKGFAGNDVLNGDAGDDTLNGGANDDTLNGGENNDTLIGQDGNDTLAGGNGIDTASYVGAVASVTVSLATTTAQNTVGDGTDTLSSIENLIGSSFGDTLSGTSGDNTISGGGNNDDVKGFAGVDTLSGDNGNDLLNGGASNDTLFGGANDDNLIGQDGDDTLAGGSGADDFIVQDNHGDDTVADFQNGADNIELIGVTGVNDFGDLTLTDTGPGVLVDYGTGTILLATVSDINTIDAGDFSFA